VDRAGSYELPFAAANSAFNGRYFFNELQAARKRTTSKSPPASRTATTSRTRKTTPRIGARYTRPFGPRAEPRGGGPAHHQRTKRSRDSFTQNPGPQDDFVLDRYSTETIGRAVLKFRQTPVLSWEAGGEAADNHPGFQRPTSARTARHPDPSGQRPGGGKALGGLRQKHLARLNQLSIETAPTPGRLDHHLAG